MHVSRLKQWLSTSVWLLSYFQCAWESGIFLQLPLFGCYKFQMRAFSIFFFYILFWFILSIFDICVIYLHAGIFATHRTNWAQCWAVESCWLDWNRLKNWTYTSIIECIYIYSISISQMNCMEALLRLMGRRNYLLCTRICIYSL